MNPKSSYSFSNKQLTALAKLSGGATITSASLSASVSRSTVCRWLNEPGFREQLTRERSEALNVIGRKLLQVGEAAVDTLSIVLQTSDNDAVRVRAAEAGLSLVLRFAELQDISERLAAVEARLTTAYGRSG
jgi:hypothetical protein